MAEIRIRGGQRLQGKLRVQGSKNAVLPILAAAVIHPGISILEQVPRISDVSASLAILRHLGAEISFEGHRLILDTSRLTPREIPQALGEQTRSSILFLGALLARFGEASLFSPGGCSIGSRPIDLHLSGLRQMGVVITEDAGKIHALVPQMDSKPRIPSKPPCIHATELTLACPSVGATEQLLLAASRADGVTILRGCAREPEIVILCQYLMHIGCADIRGTGTSTLRIHPCSPDNPSMISPPAPFIIPGDRIVAATYLGAAAITGGEITLSGISPEHLQFPLHCFRQMGCRIVTTPETIYLIAPQKLQSIPHLETAPYPGFPTDMQSLFLALEAVSSGQGILRETIFENRLRMAEELNLMGARILISSHTALVSGVPKLKGTHVHGTDLRSGAGLILAALAAEGETTVSGYEYVLRGYEEMEQNLRKLGANIL